MILNSGNKILVSHRRLYADDHARFFAGTVQDYENGIVRVAGYSWVRDPIQAKYVRKNDERIKIISLLAGTLVTYVLPDDVTIADLMIHQHKDHKVMLTDGKEFSMDLTERVPNY